jgi:hypothetical protein
MTAMGVLEILALLAALAIAVGALGATARHRGQRVETTVEKSLAEAASLQRWGTWVSLVFAVVCGVAVVVILGQNGVFAAPLMVLLVLAMGRLMLEYWLRQSGAAVDHRRSASLQPREASRYAPAGVVWLMRTSVTVGVLLAVVGMVTADRSGHGLSYACADFSGRITPWPGAEYAFPAVIVVIVTAAVAELALVRITRRAPLTSTDPPASHVDEQLRVGSAQFVLLATTASGAVCSAGIAGAMALQLMDVSCTSASSLAQSVIYGVLAIAAAVVLLVVIALASRKGRVGRTRQIAKSSSS